MISLVILSYNKYDTTTGPCLATLVSAFGDPRYETILVDNASPDGAGARCADFARSHASIRFLPIDTNLGFGGGMNAGVAQASGDWVCLVNSDTLFPPGALDALASVVERVPPKIAMLGPVTNAAGNGQRLPLPDVPLDRVAAYGAAAMQAPTGLITPSYRTDFFCVAIRTAVWRQLGGLDRIFGLGYYEDFDFSLRLAAAGFEQAIAEDVFVAHVGSSSFATMGKKQHELMARNRAIFLERHPQARMEHVREGNALALQHLIDTAQRSGWTEALKRRAAWRWAALRWDEAKTPWKRWRWRWHTRGMQQALRDAGIEPAFPT